MKTAGIIAEYNPFHKGHQYQIQALRRQYSPDYVIVAMSGDFLQRGTPALLNKYARAHMSLLQGADLILELPVCFSTASAELFARGGVLLFHTTGLTDCLCFGAESNEPARLKALAKLLCQEPDWYRNSLKNGLKEGLSYPAARAKALPEYEDLLKLPNNILALEYLKAINEAAPYMEPLLIQRKGSGYHDMDVTAPMASASAIRKELLALEMGQSLDTSPWQHCDSFRDNALNDYVSASPSRLAAALPTLSRHIMNAYQQDAAFLWEDDFSLLLHQSLLKQTQESLPLYVDMTEALANRFLRHREHYVSWSQFCQSCDSRDMTYSRISRTLTHLLLDIRTEDLTPYRSKNSGTADILPYLRVLGLRKSALPLLTELSRHARAPLITSLAKARQQLTGQSLRMLEQDISASDLYRSVMTFKTGKPFPSEYRRKLLIVD